MWFFFQAEDGIRDLVRSRGLGDVYKRQGHSPGAGGFARLQQPLPYRQPWSSTRKADQGPKSCLLYTSDAADERSSVDLGGRRIIKKKKDKKIHVAQTNEDKASNNE